MNALRLTGGFDTALFESSTGLAADRLAPGLAAARERGLVATESGHIRPTPLGRRYLNDLMSCFLPDSE